MPVENPFKGPSSYEDGDKFYGRENEIKELVTLIRNEALTLLFSRSGTGKSSLIKAGLFPVLKNQSEFFPIYIHLNDAAVRQTSAKNLCDFVIRRCVEEINNYFTGKNNYIITLGENSQQDSLFEFIHNTQILEVEKSSSLEYVIKPVLIFDQLEEIFTNPFNKSELQFLLQEIKCLTENEIPEYFRDEINNARDDEYKKLKNDLKSKQKNFRVVFSFREEYLPQFESLRKDIPLIRFTNSRYRLEPFTVETALEIIVKTAPLISPGVASNVAENIAVDVEGFDEKRVDPFLLSLICQIIYADLLVENTLSPEEKKMRIKSLVENALESYVAKVYDQINIETKKFIENKLITSDGKKNSVNYNEVESNPGLNTDILKLVDDPKLRLLSIGQFLDSRHVTILHDRLLPPLIERKEQRRLKEEKDALIARQKELEMQNEKERRELTRRKRIFYGVFVFGAVVLSLFLFGTLKEQKEVKKQKIVANNAIQRANDDSARAAYSTIRVQHLIDSLKNLTIAATIAKELADSAGALAVIEKNSADESQKNLETQKSLTALLQKSIDSNTVQRDLGTMNISPSTLGSAQLQSLVFTKLFDLQSHKDLQKKYYQTLNAIHEAVNIEHLTTTSSYEVLSKIVNLWKENPGMAIVDSILTGYLNKTLSYKQNIDLSDETNLSRYKTILSFFNPGSKKGSLNFAFNYNDNIYNGIFNSSRDTLMMPDSSSFFSSSAAINSLTYRNDTILGLTNNSIVSYIPKERNSGEKSKAINVGNYSESILSPNGQYVITYSDYDSIILWNLNKQGENTTLAVKSTGVKSIAFSKNSERILLLELYGKLTVFDISFPQSKLTATSKSILIDPRYIDSVLINSRYFDRINAANFSNSGDYLIATGVNTTYVCSLNDTNVMRPFGRTQQNSGIVYISLAPDSSRLLTVTTRGLTIYRNADNSNLISNSNKVIRDLPYKTFYSADAINAADFLNTNSILAIINSGNVYFLKVYDEFKTLNDALNTIKIPTLSTIDSLKLFPTDTALFNKILISNNERLTRSAVQFYDQNHDPSKTIKLNANLSKILYAKLADFNTKGKPQIAVDLIGVLKKLSGLDTSKKNQELYYTEIVEIAEKNTTSQSKNALSIDYGNLAFYSFFTREFKNGLKYAIKGIELDSTNNYIYTNLALGYLFMKQYDKAEKVYRDFKDKNIRNQSTTFKAGFLQDFNDLERYGVINESESDIFEEVKKIKRDILNSNK